MPKIVKGSSRRFYNIYRITKEIEANERPLDRRIKNLEVKCLKCGYLQIINIKSAFTGGVNCPRCSNRLKAEPLIMNYRMNRTPIINNMSIDTYQIGGFRIKG